MSTTTPRLLVGRYRLLSPLGQGGMGTVWRATDELLRQDVAIKEVRLPPDLDEAARTQMRERTLREARAAARLRSHPSIVTVHDVVADDGRPWIVMELVQGRSLHQMVREYGPLTPAQVAQIGLSLLDALSAAHRAGILHRDVKPGNVLITTEGRVVLTDFGIATVTGDVTLTHSGSLTGSPGFIAPERLRGEDERPESDLWSLGATLYTAVEGRVPYHREKPEAVFAAALLHDPDPMELAGPLTHVLAGLLERDPARRLSVEEAAWHLRAVAAPGAAPGPPPPPRPHAQPSAPHHSPAPHHSSAPHHSPAPYENPAPHQNPAFHDGSPTHQSPESHQSPAPHQSPGSHQPSSAHQGPTPHHTPPPYQRTSPSQQTSLPHPDTATTSPAGRKSKVPVIAGAALAAVLLTAGGLTVWRVWDSTAPTLSGGPTTGATVDPTATGSATAQAKAAFAREPRACSLINEAQAASLLGGAAKPQFQTRGACLWQTAAGTFMSVQIARWPSDQTARQAFAQIRTTSFEEETERRPETKLRDGPAVGAQAISFMRAEGTSAYRTYVTQVMFRKDNLTVLIYLTLKSSGYTRLDRAAAAFEKGIDAAR